MILFANFIFDLHPKKKAIKFIQDSVFIDFVNNIIMQVAETALAASIKDPIFHRVRDVAPNKVTTT